jgi:hypothetical protein
MIDNDLIIALLVWITGMQFRHDLFNLLKWTVKAIEQQQEKSTPVPKEQEMANVPTTHLTIERIVDQLVDRIDELCSATAVLTRYPNDLGVRNQHTTAKNNLTETLVRLLILAGVVE